MDKGIDTGGSLYEKRLTPSPSDSLSTYPLLMTAACVDISIQALQDAVENKLKPYQPQGASALRFPPPIWTWLYHGLTRRIW